MPHYDYQCTHCGHTEEIFQKITANSLTHCPQCQQETFKRKVGSGIGLQFQGSGFYSTDYGSHPQQPTPSETTTSPATSNKGCGCGKSSCKA